MEITSFFPVFFLFLLLSVVSLDLWIFSIIFLSFFQAATPFNIDALGRPIGILPAYLVFIFGLWRLCLTKPRDASASIHYGAYPKSILYMSAFFLYSSFASLVFPFLFDGVVNVAYPIPGYNESLLLPVKATPSNIVQAIYCAVNLIMLVVGYQVYGRLQYLSGYVVKAMIFGFLISLVFGIYQMMAFYLGLPWPDTFINSNSAYIQLFGLEVFGVPRVSSTFTEPSYLAMYILGAFGFFYSGGVSKFIAAGAVFLLMVSTSTTAYVGIALFALVYFFLGSGLSKQYLKIIIPAIFIGGVALWDYYYNSSYLYESFFLDKMDTSSYDDRSFVDGQAFTIFLESFGLGVGYGSHRASSMLLNMLAAVGGVGFLLFFLSIFFLYKENSAVKGGAINPYFFAFLAMLIAELIAVPDLGQPIQWLFFGFSAGFCVRLKTTENYVVY